MRGRRRRVRKEPSVWVVMVQIVVSEGPAVLRMLPCVGLSGSLQDAMGLARCCPEVVSESRLGVSFPEMERMRRCKTN